MLRSFDERSIRASWAVASPLCRSSLSVCSRLTNNAQQAATCGLRRRACSSAGAPISNASLKEGIDMIPARRSPIGTAAPERPTRTLVGKRLACQQLAQHGPPDFASGRTSSFYWGLCNNILSLHEGSSKPYRQPYRQPYRWPIVKINGLGHSARSWLNP